MTPLEQYPSARKVVYLLFWVVGLIIGAIAVYVAVATPTPMPPWLKGAQAVLAFLAVPVGYTAAANVTDTTKIAAVQPPDAPVGQLVAGPAAVDVPEGDPADVVPADSNAAPQGDGPEPNPTALNAYLEQIAAGQSAPPVQGD